MASSVTVCHTSHGRPIVQTLVLWNRLQISFSSVTTFCNKPLTMYINNTDSTQYADYFRSIEKNVAIPIWSITQLCKNINYNFSLVRCAQMCIFLNNFLMCVLLFFFAFVDNIDPQVCQQSCLDGLSSQNAPREQWGHMFANEIAALSTPK